MPLGLGLLTYFLTSKEDDILTNHKKFEVLLNE